MDRFWSKVEKTDGCWEWTAAKQRRGYGSFRVGSGTVLAHRFAYELAVGPIPEGLEVDHVCRNTSCVNPDHLEPVTHIENVRRGRAGEVARTRQQSISHCPRGHEYDEKNTYVNPNSGWRLCRTCNRERPGRAA